MTLDRVGSRCGEGAMAGLGPAQYRTAPPALCTKAGSARTDEGVAGFDIAVAALDADLKGRVAHERAGASFEIAMMGSESREM